MSATGPVAWVRVQTHIKHTNTGDLKVTLVGPAGQRVVLTDYIGDGSDDVFDGTWWEDDAGDTNPPDSSYQASFVDGVAQPVLAPMQALANFRGASAAGEWTLEVTDQATGNEGSLDDWTLELATYSGAAPTRSRCRARPAGPARWPPTSTAPSPATSRPRCSAPSSPRPSTSTPRPTARNADLAVVAKRGVPLRVTRSEAGRLRLTLKVSRKTAAALGVPRKLAKASRQLTDPGKVRLRLHVTKKHRDALGSSTKPVKLIVTVTLTDAASNVADPGPTTPTADAARRTPPDSSAV